jgi:hypothetical protein
MRVPFPPAMMIETMSRILCHLVGLLHKHGDVSAANPYSSWVGWKHDKLTQRFVASVVEPLIAPVRSGPDYL